MAKTCLAHNSARNYSAGNFYRLHLIFVKAVDNFFGIAVNVKLCYFVRIFTRVYKVLQLDTSVVSLGSEVTIYNFKTEKELKYRIVGTTESVATIMATDELLI
mgnify:CR=1 FL=1